MLIILLWSAGHRNKRTHSRTQQTVRACALFVAPYGIMIHHRPNIPVPVIYWEMNMSHNTHTFLYIWVGDHHSRIPNKK